MKYLNKILLFTSATFLLSLLGCEDVIQIDLNSIDPQIVLEANISDDSSVSTLKITQSTDYYTPGIYNGIEGAVVTISDEDGNSAIMNDVQNGDYKTDLIIGKSNTEYSVVVELDGKTYSANSFMPKKTEIDSLSIENAPNRPGGDKGKDRFILHIHFQDEINVTNYYSFKIIANNIALPGFYTFNDKYSDGKEIDARIFIDTENIDVSIGDMVSVELQSINEDVYYFYKTANGVNASGSARGGQPQSTSVAPTNPVTNWSNKALGYFSAYATSQKNIVISL